MKPATHVLVATQAAMQSAWLATVLRDAGYSVHLAADAGAALKAVHTSAEPLIVLLDASNTRFLNGIVCSRRLIHHHVYVLITPELLRLAPECEALYARLTYFVVHVPFTRDRLLQAMTRACRCLTAAYPEAPAARHESTVSTGSAKAYPHICPEAEQPSDQEQRGALP